MEGPVEATPGADVWVSEVRDYPRINAEVVRLLDLGAPVVRLRATEGQRLLLARLRGDWNAVVEIEGRAGPELAAELNSPRLTVVCRGDALDGAGRGLKAGRLFILGNAGDAVGLAQAGGLIVVRGATGARAGLRLKAGSLALLGPTGRLTGERQLGGSLFAIARNLGPFAGHARIGGGFLKADAIDHNDPVEGEADADERAKFAAIVRETRQIDANAEAVG